MTSPVSYYPEWLGPRLIDDAVEWSSAVATSLVSFLEQYTLHDSTWIGLHLQLDQAGAAIAVIRFDAFWTEGRVPHPGDLVAEWPIILIRFSGVTSIQLTGVQDNNWDLGLSTPPRPSLNHRNSIEPVSKTSSMVLSIFSTLRW